MFIFIYKKLKKITVINYIYQIRLIGQINKSVQMYNPSHSSANNYISFQWPVYTFQLGPYGTFVPTTINNIKYT
jgi:hypothetical protein